MVQVKSNMDCSGIQNLKLHNQNAKSNAKKNYFEYKFKYSN